MQILAVSLFRTNGSRGRQLNNILLYSSNLTVFPPTVETEMKTVAPGAAPTNTAPSPGSPASPTTDVAASLDKEMSNPHAIPRRHAPIEQLARQGSFRGFPALSQKMSPFKRQLSLRINELPSTVQRKTDFPMKNSGKIKCLQWNISLNCLFLLSLSVASNNSLCVVNLSSCLMWIISHEQTLSGQKTSTSGICKNFKYCIHMQKASSCNHYLKYQSTAWSVPGTVLVS